MEEGGCLTFVNVPVLSEQMTETEPSVSTVFKLLHKILFLRMMLAVMVRVEVTAIGRPSGINAMATDTQDTMSVGTEIQSGYFLRIYPAQTATRRTIIVNINPTMM